MTLPEPAKSSALISTAEEGSLDSSSRLSELYADPSFQLEWDNDLGFHLARCVVRLRKHRGLTQTGVAELMGTSQSKVARIEGAEENVTLRTIEKLADALGGRIRFGIEPAEMQIPRMPPWWELLARGFAMHATQPWGGFRMVFRTSPEPAVTVAAWTNPAAVAQGGAPVLTSTARLQLTAGTERIGTGLVMAGPTREREACPS